MLCHREKRSAHYFVPQRTIQVGHLDTWKKFLPATCATRTDCQNGCGWSPESNNCSGIGYIEADSAALAAALPGISTGGAGKGCAPSWSYSQDSGAKGPSSRRSHSPYNSPQCNTLEHAQHGRGSRVKRSHDTPYLEATQSETPFDQNLQGQPRQTLRRKTVRRCWALSQSSGQVPGAVCRREESDSSSRPNAAGFTDEEGPLWDYDSRLQTQRHNDIICSPQHARRYDYRRLSATPSASRVHPLPQENRRRDPCRSQPALDCGQLWNSQASQSDSMAQSTFAVPFALHPDFKFLVEHGRAVVSRDHRQTHPPWHVSERTRIDRGHQELYRQS